MALNQSEHAVDYFFYEKTEVMEGQLTQISKKAGRHFLISNLLQTPSHQNNVAMEQDRFYFSRRETQERNSYTLHIFLGNTVREEHEVGLHALHMVVR